MIPILIMVGLGGFMVWLVGDKHTGTQGKSVLGLLPAHPSQPGASTALVPQSDSTTPTGFLGPPLQPEEERMLCLLVLWAKDKAFAAGEKRFMTGPLAKELARICAQLGLDGTARAVLTDGPVPATEMLGRRGITVRNAIVSFARAKGAV